MIFFAAFAKISAMGIRYSALPGHTMELATALNDVLSKKWSELRGIEIVSFGVSSVKASEEDEQMIKELQRNAAFRNPTMAAAHLVGAQAEAMKAAAANEGNMGAAMGFMGMNMAANAGGNFDPMALYNAGVQQQQAQQQAAPVQSAPANGWKCACGATVSGNFCTECGAKKPANAPLYKCDKCGWEPADPANPPRFCPECGDIFNDADKQ